MEYILKNFCSKGLESKFSSLVGSQQYLRKRAIQDIRCRRNQQENNESFIKGKLIFMKRLFDVAFSLTVLLIIFSNLSAFHDFNLASGLPLSILYCATCREKWENI